jgi:hypothetical protein
MDENVETKNDLNIYQITVGKYKGKYLKDLLRDRNYCQWLLQQDWFKESYEFLYNKVKDFDPKIYFHKTEENENEMEIENDGDNSENFIKNYKYFNLIPLEELKIELSENEKICYKFYLKTIEELKNKIIIRITKKEFDDTVNIYDITAPSKWLQVFEKETLISREDFKEFINAYELPNITTIIEEIKKYGGLEYKGSQSYKIAKKRSSDQELFWEEILKSKYKDELGTQFKYENCIFDFIHIPTNKIFECKLNLKDFDERQFNKYQATLDKYNIVFLIGRDCVIDIDMETIYTTNIKEYLLYQCNIPLLKTPSKFDDIIFDFDVHEVEDIKEVI